MSEGLRRLLTSGQINIAQYDTYILFGMNELGVKYLDNILKSSFLERSESGKMQDTYAWHDGRKSIWRDIMQTIIKVNKLLGDQDERDRNPELEYGSSGIDSFSSYI